MRKKETCPFGKQDYECKNARQCRRWIRKEEIEQELLKASRTPVSKLKEEYR